MERIIVYSPQVRQYLRELIHILFKKNYFGFRKDAKEYVAKIINFIEQNISTYPAKNTLAGLLQYGNKYILYKANKKTTWYIFLTQAEQHFLVKLITNNHTDLIANFNF